MRLLGTASKSNPHLTATCRLAAALSTPGRAAILFDLPSLFLGFFFLFLFSLASSPCVIKEGSGRPVDGWGNSVSMCRLVGWPGSLFSLSPVGLAAWLVGSSGRLFVILRCCLGWGRGVWVDGSLFLPWPSHFFTVMGHHLLCRQALFPTPMSRSLFSGGVTFSSTRWG